MSSRVKFVLNGAPVEIDIEPRVTLVDALRTQLGQTGTHVGCEHGVCGACTVHLNGVPVRSCLLLGVQVEGAAVTTIEGLSGDDGGMHPVQERFIEHRGFQCGFCTPGMIMAVTALAEGHEPVTRHEVIEDLSSHICRCTGYAPIIDAACSVLRERGLLVEDGEPGER